MTGGIEDLPLASVYSGLKRLLEMNLITIDGEEPSVQGPARKFYKLTGEGARVAEMYRASMFAAAGRLSPAGGAV